MGGEITVAEACELIPASRRRVEAWIGEGRLRVVRSDAARRKRYLLRREVVAFASVPRVVGWRPGRARGAKKPPAIASGHE